MEKNTSLIHKFLHVQEQTEIHFTHPLSHWAYSCRGQERTYWNGQGGRVWWEGRAKAEEDRWERLEASKHKKQDGGGGGTKKQSKASCSFMLPSLLCDQWHLAEQASEADIIIESQTFTDKFNKGTWISQGHICAETNWQSIGHRLI